MLTRITLIAAAAVILLSSASATFAAPNHQHATSATVAAPNDQHIPEPLYFQYATGEQG